MGRIETKIIDVNLARGSNQGRKNLSRGTGQKKLIRIGVFASVSVRFVSVPCFEMLYFGEKRDFTR